MAPPQLLIRNGRVVTATEDYVADVYCAGESITRIEKQSPTGGTPVPPKTPVPLPANTQVIDAAGKLVFPGFIDPHVHIHLPFMGTYAKDTWVSASKAALIGGTTTLIEMICPAKSDEPLDAFEQWAAKAEGVSACDYSFHMGVTRFDLPPPRRNRIEQQFREIVKRGVSSFKVFLAYKGALGVDDRELYETLRLARELGVIVTAHCENETIIDQRQRELIAAGKTGPEWHEPSRPPAVEAKGVHHLMTFAQLTGAATYIVHTSCREAVDEAVCAREKIGVRVWIESVIPHLVLDKAYAELPDFEGAKYVMSPPLREKHQQAFLWEALRQRQISVVATDHAPFDFHVQKEMGRPPKSDFTKIPNGIPSVEDRINLLHTHGVKSGRIDLHTLVDCASTQPARIFGLEKKGDIAVGMDADLCVYDPDHRGVISAKTHAMATDYSAFEGWEIQGRPSLVAVRGQIMVRDGKFVGQMGGGRFLRREPGY